MPFTNPSDVARLGHRYQVILNNVVTGLTLTASRLQSATPAIKQDTTIYHELGTVDPTGYSFDSPEFNVALQEYVHAVDLDLNLAGHQTTDTRWYLNDYINNGNTVIYLLERNTAGTITGEVEFDGCVVTDITYQWRMGQPITADYTLMGRLGKRYNAAQAPHNAWQTQDTTSPGGIRIKDARLFLGGNSAGQRVFRLQSFTLKSTFRSNPVREAGTRAMVGVVVEPPDTTLDIEIAAADQQPDDSIYSWDNTYTYYNYVNPMQMNNSAIRIYDPTAAEAAIVLRSWLLQTLYSTNATPLMANVRGLVTKKYSFVVPSVLTANTGGVSFFYRDLY